MARPRKSGLDFFTFYVDFFNDERMVCIGGEFGIKGEITAVKLLCAIFRKGYFLEWNEAVKMKMLRQLPGISPELLDHIVSRLVKWGFFCRSLFDSDKVLSSVEIQQHYFFAVKDRVPPESFPYLLIEKPDFGVSRRKTPVSRRKTPVSRREIDKRKEIKRKNIINNIYSVVEGITREDFFNDFFKEANMGFVEQQCMVLRINVEEMKRLGMEVLDQWEGLDEKVHASLSDAKKHFLNTIRKKVYDLKRRTNGKIDKFQRRRGVDPSSEGLEGFKGSL